MIRECACCATPLPSTVDHRRKYCSNACRQAAYRLRRRGTRNAQTALRNVTVDQSEQIATLQATIERLIVRIESDSYRVGGSAQPAPTMRPMQPRTPSDDDLSGLIEVKQSQGNGQSALNFINSMRALDGLPKLTSLDRVSQNNPTKSPTPAPMGAPKRLALPASYTPSTPSDDDDLSLDALL